MLQRLTQFARPLQAILVLVVPFLSGCIPPPASATFRYGGPPARVIEGYKSLSSPRVGTAVVIFNQSVEYGRIKSLRAGLVDALFAQLHEKGYAPTFLDAFVLPGKFEMLSFDGTRPYRSLLQEPVFAAAQRERLSGVFVLWVNAKTYDAPIAPTGKRTVAVFQLSGHLEMYSPAGEPLCVAEAFQEGETLFGPAALSLFRVLSDEETADKLTRQALILVPARSEAKPKD